MEKSIELVQNSQDMSEVHLWVRKEFASFATELD